MYNSLVLSVVTFIYGLAAFLYLFSWVFHLERPGKAATWVTIGAWIGNTAGILLRWYESYQIGSDHGHAPLSNLYESLTFFSWTIALIYLYIERRYRNRTIGVFALPLACLALAYASLSPSKEIQPLIPALKSNWLIAHVFTCFIGYASFAVSFGTSFLFFLKQPYGFSNAVNRILSSRSLIVFKIFLVAVAAPFRLSAKVSVFLVRFVFPESWRKAIIERMPSIESWRKAIIEKIPSVELLDELTHQLVMFGFLFLTVGIITGAVWANSAWGRYWGWDPKETWSFITWLLYAALLHFRMMRGWRGRRIAILSIVGFTAVLFTYFGVNLLPGLHSYGAFQR